jgi:hypothetical protein
MHSPALALGWELWARHRWGWTAIGAGVLVVAGLAQLLPEGPALQMVGAVTQCLVFFVYLYLLSIFMYAESTLGGKAAGFPPRLFALPVRTSLLVAWPMLYGMAAAALLWLGLAWLILVPCGLARTVAWWPALVLAAWLACSQAVCWTLVRAPLLRLVVIILGVPSIVLGAAFVWATYQLEITITQVMAALGAVIAGAYAGAVAGVARDRRGDRLGWAWLGRWLVRAVPCLPARERFFPSPGAAQRWLEVRRHAWVLPAFVGLFLAMLFWATALPLSPVQVAQVVVAIIGFPAVLAFFVGFGLGKTSFWARDLQLSSFLATRPLTCAALAHTKLYAAGLSALVTWGLILLLSPLWAVLSGNVGVVRGLADTLFHGQAAWQLGLLAPVALAGLVGLTWLQLVAGMCLSLTGRAWVVNGVALLYVTVAMALTGLGIWTASHADFLPTLRTALWLVGGSLGLLKVSAAVWAWGRADNGHDAATLVLVILWVAITTCLMFPLYAVVPEGAVPRHLVALYIVLALPFARLIALPAAVAWNRHR